MTPPLRCLWRERERERERVIINSAKRIFCGFLSIRIVGTSFGDSSDYEVLSQIVITPTTFSKILSKNLLNWLSTTPTSEKAYTIDAAFSSLEAKTKKEKKRKENISPNNIEIDKCSRHIEYFIAFFARETKIKSFKYLSASLWIWLLLLNCHSERNYRILWRKENRLCISTHNPICKSVHVTLFSAAIRTRHMKRQWGGDEN